LRSIGTLPKTGDPRLFEDYLVSLGMQARLDERPDGWLVWIYDENHLAQARAELQSYLEHPQDPRFAAARRVAEEVRRRQAKLEHEYRKNFREVSDQWSGLRFRQRPLTLILVATSILVFLLTNLSAGSFPGRVEILQSLLISPTIPVVDETGGARLGNAGLQKIRQGQVWRLVTPIFLHFGILHILFNSWATTILGTVIETRRGTGRLLVLVLVAAVLSNLAQFAFVEAREPGQGHLFGGMSGVCYALFGYLWMKGRYDPEPGMVLHPNTITTMLIWLVLCMTGLLGPIANTAHVVGLAVGAVFGVLRL
jgi:GlpG protein